MIGIQSIKTQNKQKRYGYNPAFGAGLTPKIMHEIQNTDILEISRKLQQKGIPSDFKGNKIIAWCSNKTVEIFEQLNKKFGMHLALPKGIFVEDFKKLNLETTQMYGFCNFQPTHLHKNSNIITPSRVLFFNSFDGSQNKNLWHCNWENINEIADTRYLTRASGTNLFLDIFLHEASHVSHEDRLLKKMGGELLATKIGLIKNDQEIANYQKKYGAEVSRICNYALENQFEAIACDIPRVITSSLDKETLMPTKNPFIGSPYEKLSFWQKAPKYSDNDKPLKEILRSFWNGHFE